MPRATGAGGPERPRCRLCGGELRLSHREYSGSGRSTAVLRCGGCGSVTRGAESIDRDRSATPSRRRKPLPEGGPPENYVLDPETADRLRRSLGDDGGGG